MDDIYVGRQPIYNRKLEVVGYELLYRSSLDNQAQFLDGDQATGEVILNTFLELGLENIAGRYPAFINLSRSFLVGDKPLPFSHKRVVLEILEDTVPDATVIDALRRLVQAGYIIALDDFVYRPELEPLLELAHIVKLDVYGTASDVLAQRVAQLRPRKLRLLAEKVETHEEFERCKQLGFDYFQGYFFSKPNIMRGRSRPANRLALMTLLAELQHPDTDINKLEALVAQDAALTYRLLRYANSPCVAIRRKVESLRRALVIIGANTIKNWITLILFTRIDDKPRELVVTALVRARMCELLGAAQHHDGLDRFFTVGLLSAMDALMDQTMEEVLDGLPLVDEVKVALRSRDGKLGQVLEQVLLYEWGAWERLCQNLDCRLYRQAYLDAVRWAGESLPTLLGADADGAVTQPA
jgi:Predicted signal transduction protein containing EAL and modified HD-GYP domains